jgi:hypothetical protein
MLYNVFLFLLLLLILLVVLHVAQKSKETFKLVLNMESTKGMHEHLLIDKCGVLIVEKCIP